MKPPAGGEPENYIYRRNHNADMAAALGKLSALVFEPGIEIVYGDELHVIANTWSGEDFFSTDKPQLLGNNYVSQRAAEEPCGFPPPTPQPNIAGSPAESRVCCVCSWIMDSSANETGRHIIVDGESRSAVGLALATNATARHVEAFAHAGKYAEVKAPPFRVRKQRARHEL